MNSTILNYNVMKDESQLENNIDTRLSMQQLVMQALSSRMPQNPGTAPQQQLNTGSGFNSVAQ